MRSHKYYEYYVTISYTIGPVWYNFPDESSMETDELPLLKQASYNPIPLGVPCVSPFFVCDIFLFLFFGCTSNTSFLNNVIMHDLFIASVIMICNL